MRSVTSLKTVSFLIVFLLSACEGERPLDLRGGDNTLLVLSRNSPTSYYLDRDQAAGLEHDLVQAFASARGYQIRFVLADTTAEVLQRLREGSVDLAAAGLSYTPGRARQLLAGPEYQQVTQQLVCRRGGPRPGRIADLVGLDIQVPSDSSYVQRLQALKTEHPQLTWQQIEGASSEDLLWRVWKKQTDCTVADSNIVAINRRYYPELLVHFDINEPESLVWYLPSGHQRLRKELDNWLNDFLETEDYDRLVERYTGFIDPYDYVDNRKFIRGIKSALPKYRQMFETAAKKYRFVWQLLAAQAYQESRWNPKARSPTGVRGMMMLTLTTARELGVSSRLDPQQSIDGGADYLSRLYKRLPEAVQEPDRTWFALAAYNVGMGHLWDARKLATEQGLNPNLWKDVKTVFPLLTRKRYYRRLKYGYARGHEPVRYVQRIRDFHDILTRYQE